MEQPYLPRGVAPNDIYRCIGWMPDGSGSGATNAELVVQFDLTYGEANQWYLFWKQEVERVRLLGIQADKEWALKELLLRSKHAATTLT